MEVDFQGVYVKMFPLLCLSYIIFYILYQMATKPLTTEAIALTEKKMDMALEDIIKMSKNPKSKIKNQQRVPVRSLFCESIVYDLSSIVLGCYHNI